MIPPRPHDLTVDQAAELADELRRRADWMRRIAESIDTDPECLAGPVRDAMAAGWMQAGEHLDREAEHLVRCAHAYRNGLELGRAGR